MAKNIPKDINRDDILNAITAYESGSVRHNFHESEKYDLLHDGKRFPPKAILGIAARRSAGYVLEPSDFSGGEGSACFRVLRHRGFEIVLKPNAKVGPKTFLYTWNPSKWDWTDLKDVAQKVQAGSPQDRYWSCGHTKRISIGDRFLLMRLGVDPKGVVGCGEITSEPYLLPHWNEEKKAKGEKTLRTNLRFTVLAESPILALDDLMRRYPDVLWTPQGSGNLVPEEVASGLIAILTSVSQPKPATLKPLVGSSMESVEADLAAIPLLRSRGLTHSTETQFGALLTQVAQTYSEYRDNRIVSKDSPVYRLVHADAPALLSIWARDYPELEFEGSTGQGNVTIAPWVRGYYPTIASSAQDGFYIVYLFSVDLTEIYLTLGIGAFQFTSRFGETEGVKRLRTACAEFARVTGNLAPARLSRGPIDLRSEGKSDLHYSYSQGSIYSLPAYKASALPSDAQLRSDLLEFCSLYRRLKEYPLTPDLSDLLDSVTPSSGSTAEVILSPFVIREPPKKSGKGGKSSSKRRSAESKVVGDLGEQIAFKAELKRLRDAGRPDLAGKVEHVASKGLTPGYDILSFETSGAFRYVEVKASSGKKISTIELTANEWSVASHISRAEAYHIYLVTGVFSNSPQIEVLINPLSYVERGKLQVKPSVYLLDLRGTAANETTQSESAGQPTQHINP